MIGLYLVLWGKTAAETKIQNQHNDDILTKHMLQSNNKTQECPGEADIP